MKRFLLCLLLLLASGGPGWAYTIVQNVTGGDSTGNSVTTLTLTIAAIGAHNTGMGYVSWYQGGTGSTSVSVKFGSNDTASVPQLVTGDVQWLAGYYLNNITDAPTTVVFTFSGGSANQGRNISANFTEVSGAGALDTSTMQWAQNITAATDAATSGNITPAQSGDFLFGGNLLTYNHGNTITISAGTNYTLNNANTLNAGAETDDEYRTYNSVAAVAGTFSFTSGGEVSQLANMTTGIMAFPVAASCHSLALLGVGC